MIKMASKEIDDKKRLVALADSIREKYKKFRFGEANYEARMERKFKPLLKARPEQTDDSRATSLPFSEHLVTEDIITGLRRGSDENSYNLGTFRVYFSKDKIKVADREYPITKGLLSLLTRKKPLDYSDEDKENYKQMLVVTKAHLRKSDGKFKTSGPKTHFIKELFNISKEEGSKSENQQFGEGMSWIKLIKSGDNIKKSYTYWDDPNELVERLYLLHASQKAGNNSVSAEIASIESELREAGYIY